MASPAPQIDFAIQHYDVSGATTDEINASIFQNTPVRIDGRKFGALTVNKFSTNYSTINTSSGGCEVKNVRIGLNSKVILPRLANQDVSDGVRAEWFRYINALAEHERLHANNGKQIAETLSKRLFGFASDLSCKETTVLLNRGIDRLIGNMSEWDRALDHATEHGRAQGAYLRGGIR